MIGLVNNAWTLTHDKCEKECFVQFTALPLATPYNNHSASRGGSKVRMHNTYINIPKEKKKSIK